MSTVALAQDLGIETTSDLKQQLAPLVAHSGEVRVDAGLVARVHTAAIQVLCAFVQARRQAGYSTAFDNSSDTFHDAARLLGVLQALGLETPHNKQKSVENAA